MYRRTVSYSATGIDRLVEARTHPESVDLDASHDISTNIIKKEKGKKARGLEKTESVCTNFIATQRKEPT